MPCRYNQRMGLTTPSFASPSTTTSRYSLSPVNLALPPLLSEKSLLPPASTRAKSPPRADSSSRARVADTGLVYIRLVSPRTSCLKFIPASFFPRTEYQEFCFLDYTVNRTTFHASVSLDHDHRPPRDCYVVVRDRPRPGRANGISLIVSCSERRGAKSETVNCVFEQRQVRALAGQKVGTAQTRYVSYPMTLCVLAPLFSDGTIHIDTRSPSSRNVRL